MKPDLTTEQLRELDAFVVFLKQTKDGKYAPVEESSLRYARMGEMRTDDCADESYFHSLR